MNYHINKRKDGTHGLTRLRIQEAKENGINEQCLRNRLSDGWDIKRAVSQPVGKKGRPRNER